MTMSKQGYAWSKLNEFLAKKTGIFMKDLPDFDIHGWIEDDMTNEQVDELVPDMAWDILDSSGMDRDTVDNICYGE